MDYQRIYQDIIRTYQGVQSLGYTEGHHIIPRSMGGSDDPSNIVRLPPRHHFIAHLCLARIYGGKMAYAAWRMSNYSKYTSREYAWLKSQSAGYLSDIARGRVGDKNPMHGKRGALSQHYGKTHSPERRQKISDSQKGKRLSPEIRAKIAKSKMGQKASEETKQKMAASHRGKKLGPMSDKQKAELSRLRTGTKASPQARAKMSESGRKRWALRKESS